MDTQRSEKLPASKRAAIVLGSRWSPGSIERRDTSTGFFEAINPPIIGHAETRIQRALLKPVSKREARRIEMARTAGRTGGAQ